MIFNVHTLPFICIFAAKLINNHIFIILSCTAWIRRLIVLCMPGDRQMTSAAQLIQKRLFSFSEFFCYRPDRSQASCAPYLVCIQCVFIQCVCFTLSVQFRPIRGIIGISLSLVQCRPMVWSTVPYCASEKASVSVSHIVVSQPTSVI